jgi:hypothetical protein
MGRGTGLFHVIIIRWTESGNADVDFTHHVIIFAIIEINMKYYYIFQFGWKVQLPAAHQIELERWIHKAIVRNI